MSIHHSIEVFVGLNLLIIGMSHTFRPQAWVLFFEHLSSRGEVGNFFNALLTLGMGTLIVAFHWVWEGPMIIVTIYGIMLTLKGGIYVTIPKIGLNAISGKQVKKANFIRVGVIMILLSVYIFCYSCSLL